MKLTISKKALVAALSTVKPVAGKNSSLPILAHVAIRTYAKSVEFIGSNLDMFLRVRTEAEIDDPGDFCVSAAMLYSIINSLPEAKEQDALVTLHLVKKMLRITCDKSLYNLGIMAFDEFPPLPKLKDGHSFKVGQADFLALMTATSSPALAADEQRYALTGNLLSLNGCLTSVSTDGRRLHLAQLDFEEKLPKAEVIVPRAAITELLRLLSDDEDKTMNVTFADNHIRFDFGEITLISRIVEAQFPNYKQVIPSLKDATTVVLSRVDFLEALKRTALVGAAASLEFSGQMLTISSECDKKGLPGDACESMLIPKTRSIKQRCATRYLIEALSAIPDDEIQFCNLDRKSPIMLKQMSGSWQAVIMPLTEVDLAPPQAEEAKAETTDAAKADAHTKQEARDAAKAPAIS